MPAPLATVAAVALPAAVTADRAKVSSALAAVATAKAALVAAVAANDANAIQSASTAYQAARLALEADMQTLRTDARGIMQQDEEALADDHVLLEIYTITNNATAFAAAKEQLEADHAQAEANRDAIFGNPCPSGVICLRRRAR